MEVNNIIQSPHQFNRSPRSFQYLPPLSNVREQYSKPQSVIEPNDELNEFPASPSFRKGRTQSQYYIQQFTGFLSVNNNNFISQIKPKIQSILSDRVTANKQVNNCLEQLRNLQQKLEMDMSSSEQFKTRDYQKRGFLNQINRIIDRLMMNSDQETEQFRQNLHNFKNFNASLLEEQIQQKNSDQQDSQSDQNENNVDHETSKDKAGQVSYHNFLDQLSNIQSRLFNEIVALRKEKQQIFQQLNFQRQRNNDLERDYYNLQTDYNRLLDQLNRNNRDNYRHQPQKSNKHIDRHPNNHQDYRRHERKRSQSKGPTHNNNNLKNIIGDLESRLRQASSQKQHLQRAINNFMSPQTDFNTRKTINQIQTFNVQLANSQRKAAKLFPYKLNSDRLNQQYEISRGQNNRFRKQIELQNYKRANPSSYDYNYKRDLNSNGYEYTMRQRQQDYSSSGNSRQQTYQNKQYLDKIQEYKQVLNTIRSINR